MKPEGTGVNLQEDSIFSSKSIESQTGAQYAVTLIHGTKLPFLGGDAPFMKAESDLRKKLSQYGSQVIQYEFNWSGRNSHRARKMAASELADQLKACIARHPTAEQYIISHSHGGNVALYASKYLNEEERKQLKGVVCMATPFIDCEPREIEERVSATASIASLLPSYLASTIPFAIWAAVFVLVIAKNLSITGNLLILGTIFLVDIPRVATWMWMHKKLRIKLEDTLLSWAQKRQNKTISEVSLPDSVPFTVLSAYPAFDEPRMFLRLSTLVANLPHYALRPVLLYNLFVCSVFALIAFAFIVPALIASLPKEVRDSDLMKSITNMPAPSFAMITGLSLVLLVLFSTIALVLYLLSILFMPLARIHPFAFGMESPVDSWFVNIGVRDTPSCRGDVQKAEYQFKGWGIKHCQIYVNGRFLDDLESLAKGLVGRKRVEPSKV